MTVQRTDLSESLTSTVDGLPPFPGLTDEIRNEASVSFGSVVVPPSIWEYILRLVRTGASIR